MHIDFWTSKSARDEDIQLVQLFFAAVFTVRFAVANASRPSCNIFCAGGESSYDANRCDAKVVSNLVPCTAYFNALFIINVHKIIMTLVFFFHVMSLFLDAA